MEERVAVICQRYKIQSNDNCWEAVPAGKRVIAARNMRIDEAVEYVAALAEGAAKDPDVTDPPLFQNFNTQLRVDFDGFYYEIKIVEE